MINYITGILSFLKHGPTTDSSTALPVDVEQYSQRASCRGWSTPDPDVRLRLSDNKAVRIFGFPNEEDIPSGMDIPFMGFGNTGSPKLYLRVTVPAYVSYIMGEDWRSRLRGDHYTNNTHLFHDGEVILRPSTTTLPPQQSQHDLELSEASHCLRMRRCGAVVIRSETDALDSEIMGEPELDHLFGWPSTGGVWILRLDPIETSGQDFGLQTRILHERFQRLELALKAMKQQDDMDGICLVLKEAGGQFYANIEHCPEVQRLNLLK